MKLFGSLAAFFSAWGAKLAETFLEQDRYRMLLEGLGNTLLITVGALGIGVLTCIRDAGMKEPYVGKIDFVTGEIADDMTAYFWISEQQQTSVSLGVKLDENAEVKAAGGRIIQMLPDANEE